MKSKISGWDYVKSFLFPVLIERRYSPVNPRLDVTINNGKLMLDSAGANYSFGGLHRVFQVAFKKINFQNFPAQHVLLLGLGAGSVPTIIYEELKMNPHIKAIEKDEVVIALAKKHFGIDRFTNLDIVCTDAFDYLQQSKESFNAIIIDIYEDIHIPAKFETRDFLQLVYTHLQPGGIMVFNKVKSTPELLAQYKLLVKASEDVFTSVQSVKASPYNEVIVGKR